MRTNIPTTPDPLALRLKDAARAMGIGQRKLWALTQPRGPIPAVKIGTCVVYPVDGLRKWLADEAAKAASHEGGTP